MIRNRTNKAIYIGALAFMAVACLLAVTGGGADAVQPSEKKSHMDRLLNPEECMACHAGRGVSGTSLLKKAREEMCYECHGDNIDGRPSRANTNIEQVMRKLSIHLIANTSMYHGRDEVLPEDDALAPRHVACADCHRTHISSEDAPTKGASGYRLGDVRGRSKGMEPPGLRMRRASFEYEICYRCHSDSLNMPDDARNIADEFNPINPSYHPVELSGKNKSVPSLIPGMNENSVIGCNSCHGNDNPFGPQGPHGSNFTPILKRQYKTMDGPEFLSSYELCYMCHDRDNILSNASFSRHKEHIVNQETSCYTCHASHGSKQFSYLLSFSLEVVGPSNSTGAIDYIPGGAGSPRCYLSCHGTWHEMEDVAGNPWPW